MHTVIFSGAYRLKSIAKGYLTWIYRWCKWSY